MTAHPIESKPDPPASGPPAPTAASAILKRVLFVGALLFIVLAMYLVIRESRPGGVIKRKTVGGPTQLTRPSLLVKPFHSDTTAEMTAILALGLSDDVRRRLIREPGLLLVSCPAPLGHQPEPLKPGPVPAHHQVADYILRGTVQPNGPMPRLTVALIDGVSGEPLWQHRYTISHPVLYAIREDITRQVLGALGISPNPTSSGAGTSTVPSEKAWRLTVRGKYPTHKGADAKLGWRLDKFEQAVASDSSYAEAWRMLSLSHFETALSAVNADQQMDRALSCAETAIALNRQSSRALALRAAALLWQRQYEYAHGVAVSAVAEGPSDLFAHMTMARSHYALGRYEAAVASSHEAQLLNPCDPVPALLVSARAHRMQGALTEAKKLYTEIIQREISHDAWRWQAHLDLAELYRGSNDLHAAQAQLRLAMDSNRDLSVEQLRRIYWYDNPQQLRKRRANLRHTGLPETTPPKLRLEPSIVILPFISDTPDETDAWFIDGLGDYLTELFSRSQSMMVIAHSAGKALHNTFLNREELALQLGADYLISPHVRYRADDQVVIEVTLRNPILGMALWKAAFSGPRRQIPNLLQEVVQKTVNTVTFWPVRKIHNWPDPCFKGDTAAFTCLLKGRHKLHDRTRDGLLAAHRWADALLQAAPDCSEGYRLKAQSYLEAVWFGLTSEPQSILEKGAELARHTLRMVGTNPHDHALLGVIYLLQQQYEQALSAGRKALEMGPHDAHTYFMVGIIFRYVRQYDDALFAFNRAVRLDPVTPLYYLNALAWTYLLSEQPDKALEVINRSLARNPDNLFAELGQVAANCLTGRKKLAQHQAARLRRRHPHFRLAEWAGSEPYQYRGEIQDLMAALGRSGLP